MYRETITCPVCQKKLLVVGIQNHIIGRAKGELWQWYFKRSNIKKHLDYVSKKASYQIIKRIKLSL